MKGTILYVGNFELPDKGASANRVVSNGKLFAKLGYKVAYLGVKKQAIFTGVQTLDGKQHMYEESYPKGMKQWFLHMYSVKNIEAVLNQYEDVCMVILYNVPFLLLRRVKHLFRKSNIKVVYDCTEWTGVTDGALPKRIVKKLDEYFIRTKIANVADGLIVISKRMQKAYKKNRHLILIPPLVDLKDEIWHQKMEKKSDSFEFCFAGMLDGNKESLDCIVEAFGNLNKKNTLLRIIGVTEQQFCDFYQNGKKLLDGIGEKIQFMGRLSHKETIQYVANCDCYIFIRQSDTRNNAGFPTKFSESFSCGVPIIATDISDIKGYMENRKRGSILPSVSVKEVEKAMCMEMKYGEKVRKEEKLLDEAFHYETYLEVCKSWMNGF